MQIAESVAGQLYADTLGPRTYKRFASVMSSQVAKTETCFNVIGQKLHDDPQPIIYIGPTKSNIDNVIEPRIEKMLRGCAYLWDRTLKGKRAQKLTKRVNGVEVRLAWSGSATEVASMPAGLIVLDEVDRMEPIKGEGDVVELSKARIATYPNGQQLLNSSPTLGVVDTLTDEATGITYWKPDFDPAMIASPIWRLWQEGTRFEWAVKCRGCGLYFVPRRSLLHVADDRTPETAAATAGLVCSRKGCGYLHTEAEKLHLNDSGLFLCPGLYVDTDGKVRGVLRDTDTASFWISGLMSPWVSFGERASSYLKAERSREAEKVQAVVNTAFGELYSEQGPASDWEAVRTQCAGAYRYGVVPTKTQAIFVTVDVQSGHLYYVVRGWGREFRSWLIEAGMLYGATDMPEVWAALERLVMRTYTPEGTNQRLPVSAVAVDAGYRQEHVLAFTTKHSTFAYATKGNPRALKPFSMSRIEVSESGRVLAGGAELWTVRTNQFKGWVHDRMAWPLDAANRWVMADDTPEEYVKQLLGEYRVKKPDGSEVWHVRGANHWLDCEALQVFLAYLKGVNDLEEWQPQTSPRSEHEYNVEGARGGYVLQRRESTYLSD